MRHMNLFQHAESATKVYELMQADQARGLRQRSFWQIAFVVSGGLTIGALYKESDWWNLAAGATLIASYPAAYFMIETSCRNYCMHVLTMLVYFDRSKRDV